jgi:hypothetical protein
MHGLQWSPQKPKRRALERDEKAIDLRGCIVQSELPSSWG